VAISNSPHYDLAALAVTSDATAHRELVKVVGARVRGIVSTVLRNPTDAEDAVQATWVEILTSTSNYRGENLSAWVASISGRTAMRHARRRMARTNCVDCGIDLETLSVGTQAMSFPSHELPRPLLEYLAALAAPLQLVILLRYVLEYSIAEISAQIQVPANTVKGRLIRARAELRRAIRRELAMLPVPSRPRGRSVCRRSPPKHAELVARPQG